MTFKFRLNKEQYNYVTDFFSQKENEHSVLIASCGTRKSSQTLVFSIFTIDVLHNANRVSICNSIEKMKDKSDKEITIISSSHNGLLDSLTIRQQFGHLTIDPNGDLSGSWITENNKHEFNVISVAGDNLHYWFSTNLEFLETPEFSIRNQQAFGAKTTSILQQLSIAVVGCSGTGSVVIEQLVRLGVKHLVLVDPDNVEIINLNRISFSKIRDVGRYKVEVAQGWIDSVGLQTEVDCITTNLFETEAIKKVAECDILFGCMDSSEGRYLLNRISTYYSLPYIDVGVRLDADGIGGINQICGTVNYLKPGGSSLLSRKSITMKAVEAEGLRRTNPLAYKDQLDSKYIKGVSIDSPAVISVNMHYASLAVMEMLARLHPYRVEENSSYAQFGSSLTDPRFDPVKADENPCQTLLKHVGRGDTQPLLGLPCLSEVRVA